MKKNSNFNYYSNVLKVTNDNFEKYNLSLKITGLGRNKIDYHYNFNYVTNNNLVGSCNDSSYCIIGGMR